MSSIATSRVGAEAPTRSRSLRALAAVNFFLADVRDGLGPFLGIFLIGRGWDTGTIGLVMTIGGIAGMLATTPLGALADASRAKRLIVAVCAALTILASVVILLLPGFTLVAASQLATGIAGAAIGPAVASLTLGLVGQRGLTLQLGRNEAFNHAGNVVAAAGAGWFGYEFGIAAVFILMTAMAVASIVAVMSIRAEDIDHDVARGLARTSGGKEEAPSGFSVLWRSTPLLVLAATLMLFHFGNGAMLPLLGQQRAAEAQAQAAPEPVGAATAPAPAGAADTPAAAVGPAPTVATAGRPATEPSLVETFLANPVSYTALTIIIAQLTMIPVALLAASFASRRGYFLLLVAALVALPIRGLIAGLWHNEFALVPVQILDGVGAGLLGVAVPGLVARMLNGTGHINAGLGAVMTVQGIGASLSPGIAGIIVSTFGFSAGYLSLAGFAICGLVLWIVATPKVAAACAPGA